MKNIITKIMISAMCVLSVFISCNDDDDDENNEPNYAFRSMWRQEQQKEYEARLSSEILAVFNNALTAENTEKN